MDFKLNFNRLHYLLTEKFEDVTVFEKSNRLLGNYIEININEKVNCRVIINKRDLESESFNWLYYSNPVNESSHLITRKSTIDSFTDVISDIINNRRFDSNYIETLK